MAKLQLSGIRIIDYKLGDFTMKKIYMETGFLVLTNILFYSLTKPIQEIVKSSFNVYGSLNVKGAVEIMFIVLLLVIGIVYVLRLISVKYHGLGLLSVFNVVTSVFWVVLLIATMDYSLSWNRFHTAEKILILSFYMLPLSFAVAALVYRKKTK